MRVSLRAGLVASLLVSASLPLLPTAAGAQEETLPAVSFTSEQVDRGRADYRRNCLDCHGASLDDGEFGGPPLKGVSFQEKWFGTTADGLYSYISTMMPPDRPGRLSPQTYADVTAYILSANGIRPGATELPPDEEALGGLMVE
jgi:mono/diheme cytochrome c family protein